MRRFVKIGVIAVIVLALTYCLTLFVLLQRSEAYAFARDFLANNSALQEKLGTFAVKPDYFGTNPFKRATGSNRRFEFHLDGEQENAAAFVELQLTDGKWSVTCSKIARGEYMKSEVVAGCS